MQNHKSNLFQNKTSYGPGLVNLKISRTITCVDGDFKPSTRFKTYAIRYPNEKTLVLNSGATHGYLRCSLLFEEGLASITRQLLPKSIRTTPQVP